MKVASLRRPQTLLASPAACINTVPSSQSARILWVLQMGCS